MISLSHYIINTCVYHLTKEMFYLKNYVETNKCTKTDVYLSLLNSGLGFLTKIIMNNKKTNYVAPMLSVVTVLLEQGIAAGSAGATPGGSDGSSNPGIDDLETETSSKDLIF